MLDRVDGSIARTKGIDGRDGAPLWKGSCGWEDPWKLLHGLNVSVLRRHTRFSGEAPGSFLMAPARTTSLRECCGVPSRLSSALD